MEKIIKNKGRIIGLGEFSHGTKECWSYRMEVVKELSKVYDNIDIFIEDMHIKTRNIQDVIKNNKKIKYDDDYYYHDTYPLINYVGYRIYDCVEFVEFIKLLRALNKTTNINIFGIDVLSQEIDVTKSEIVKYNKLENNKDKYMAYLLNNVSKYKNRDKFMADTITKLYNERKNISLYLAHDYHVSKNINKTTGYYLKKYFGNKYISIGTASTRGSVRVDGEFPGSKPIFYKKPKIHKFVDLGDLAKLDLNVGEIYDCANSPNRKFFNIGWAKITLKNTKFYQKTENYDYIINLGKTTHTHNIQVN
jgi:erythromycin esterase-like protein